MAAVSQGLCQPEARGRGRLSTQAPRYWDVAVLIGSLTAKAEHGPRAITGSHYNGRCSWLALKGRTAPRVMGGEGTAEGDSRSSRGRHLALAQLQPGAENNGSGGLLFITVERLL